MGKKEAAQRPRSHRGGSRSTGGGVLRTVEGAELVPPIVEHAAVAVGRGGCRQLSSLVTKTPQPSLRPLFSPLSILLHRPPSRSRVTRPESWDAIFPQDTAVYSRGALVEGVPPSPLHPFEGRGEGLHRGHVARSGRAAVGEAPDEGLHKALQGMAGKGERGKSGGGVGGGLLGGVTWSALE